jgi:hypothetical protein
MSLKREGGLLEEVRVICENHFKRHRKGDRRQGMTTHFQFMTLASTSW